MIRLSKSVLGWSVAVSLLVAVGLAGCAFQRAQEASDAQISMVGLARGQVLACMGAPDSRAADGATEVWTYHTGNGDTEGGGYVSRGGFFSASSVTRSCKVDVVMLNGAVSRIQYSGLTGGLITEGEQCAYAVGNCLGARPVPVSVQQPLPAPAPNQNKRPCTRDEAVQRRVGMANGYTDIPDCQ